MLMNVFFGPVVNAARGVAYQVQAALSGFTENIAVAFKKVGVVYCIIRFILCHIDPAEVIETVVK